MSGPVDLPAGCWMCAGGSMRAAADRASGVAMSWQFQRCFSAGTRGARRRVGSRRPGTPGPWRLDVAWEMWTLRVWKKAAGPVVEGVPVLVDCIVGFPHPRSAICGCARAGAWEPAAASGVPALGMPLSGRDGLAGSKVRALRMVLASVVAHFVFWPCGGMQRWAAHRCAWRMGWTARRGVLMAFRGFWSFLIPAPAGLAGGTSTGAGFAGGHPRACGGATPKVGSGNEAFSGSGPSLSWP